MVAAEHDGVGAGLTHLLDHGGVVHRAGGHAFEQHHFGLAAFLDELLRELGVALAVVALVVQHGDLLGAELVDGKIDAEPAWASSEAMVRKKVGYWPLWVSSGLVAEGDMVTILASV
jgi:hypothetical protein